MYTYYHITPAPNVPRILREGLVPSRMHGIGLSSLKGSSTVGKLFVTSDPEDARDIVDFQYKERWSDRPDWVVLRVRTRERGKADPDFFKGYYYLTKPIPPKSIDVFMEFGNEGGYFTPKEGYEDTLKLFYEALGDDDE